MKIKLSHFTWAMLAEALVELVKQTLHLLL
jgi:hypothetical protein